MRPRPTKIQQDFFGIFLSVHHSVFFGLSKNIPDLCFSILEAHQPNVASLQRISYPEFVLLINDAAERLGCFRYDCPPELSATTLDIDVAHAALKNATMKTLMKCRTHREMLSLSIAVAGVREMIDERSPVVGASPARAIELEGVFIQSAHMRFNNGGGYPNTFDRKLAARRAVNACRKIVEDTSFDKLGSYLAGAFRERKAILNGARHGESQVSLVSHHQEP